MGRKRLGREGTGRGWRASVWVVVAAGCLAVGCLTTGCLTARALGQASGGGAAQGGGTARSEERQAPMTKAQGRELLRSVDEILNFVSGDTKLPIVHSVKRRLISREEVTRYLQQKFAEDEGAKRLERSEIVLKKFGLLDRDFHLRPFLVKLLTEQIAGFYDNKTKVVNLLDWIQPEEQKPVLAHELTHALQDQHVDLTKWSDVSVDGVAQTMQEDNKHLQADEVDTARSAVAEGQAMVTFIDYTLRPAGKTLADAPELAGGLKDAVADMGGSPVLARAPLLLQQSLLFPYSEGLSFEQAVLTKSGVEGAFAGVLDHPPTSSFEIMTPGAYLAHAPVPSMLLPDIHPLLAAEYVPYDVGVMGELDVRIMTELFGGQEMAVALAPAWKGGIYYAAQRRSAVTAAEKESTASIALLYSSRWENADSARSFERVYVAQLPRKYAHLVRRPKEEADDTEQVYSTEEGDVLISMSGTGVFVAEGFALPLARQLRDSIAAVQGDGRMQVAEGEGGGGSCELAGESHELSLGLAHSLAGFGLVKAEMGAAVTAKGMVGGDILLRDLTSGNGTLVNGTLRNGIFRNGTMTVGADRIR